MSCRGFVFTSKKLSTTTATLFSGKGGVKHLSTFSRPLSMMLNFVSNSKELADNNSLQEYSKDVIDLLKGSNLKPVHVYESLNKKSTQDKVLKETRYTAGVYIILNKINLSCYVGSVSTNKLNARFRKHLFNFTGSKIVKAAVKKVWDRQFCFYDITCIP